MGRLWSAALYVAGIVFIWAWALYTQPILRTWAQLCWNNDPGCLFGFAVDQNLAGAFFGIALLIALWSIVWLALIRAWGVLVCIASAIAAAWTIAVWPQAYVIIALITFTAAVVCLANSKKRKGLLSWASIGATLGLALMS